MDLTSRQLLVAYVLVTFAFGYFVEWFLLRTVGTTYSLPYLVLMFIPGVVALALSWYSGNMFSDFGLNVPADTHWLTAYVVPAVVAMFTLGLTVAFGAAHFIYPGASAITKLIVFKSTIGVGISLVPAIGFELGWRGFMYTHVKRAQIPLPGLLIGLCAAAWQWPLIAFGELGNGDAPGLALGLFTIATCGSSVFLCWLRARSNSLAPVALAHAVHVTWLHQIAPTLSEGTKTAALFTGEAGLGVALAYAFIAVFCLNASAGYD